MPKWISLVIDARITHVRYFELAADFSAHRKGDLPLIILSHQFVSSLHETVFWFPLIPYCSTSNLEFTPFLHSLIPDPVFIPKASQNSFG